MAGQCLRLNIKMTENKSILSLIKLKYRHDPEELELWLKAWAHRPTLKIDCPTTQKFKELAREDYVKKLKKQKVSIN